MKIAVTYDNGQVFQHFGKTAQFLICTAENGQVTGSEVVDTEGQGHGMLPGFLKAHGVDVVICGGLGNPMVSAIANAGMKLVAGASGDAMEAVNAYLAGRLLSNMSAVHECDHHHG